MECCWAVFGVSIILAASSALGASNSLTLYNTTSVCFFDAAHTLEIDCYGLTDPRFSLVYIHRVFYGLTPLSGTCSASSPREDCCPEPSAVTDEDCLLASVDQAAELRKKCDGTVSCSTNSMARASVGEACPNMTSGRYFDFAFVEYGCVEDDLLIDVCDSSVTQTESALFLESNFYDDNQDHSDKTCSCVVRTDCQQALVFEMLKVDLQTDPTDSETCTETVELTEGDPSTVLTSLNCTTGVLASLNRPEGEGGVVQSSSSVVNFRLHITASHTGSLLVGVTATDGAPVEVSCGQSSENVTECITPSTTTTTESPPIDLSSPMYNSTDEACLHGAGSIADVFEIECPDGQGLISVERVFHGLTPQDWDCHASASKNSCCPGFDPARDCLFATEEGVTALRKSCDGNLVCFPKLERATVPSGACLPRDQGNVTYDDYSTFAFVEYSCINVGLVSDICDAGNTIRGSQVFLERNLHHFGGTEAAPTCSCVVSTTCGHQLLLYALLLELFETSGPDGGVVCLESVSIVDGDNSTVSVDLDCSSNEIDEVPTKNRSVIFQSQSNVVNFQLHLQPGNNKGKILLKIEATEEALVEVRCGRTTALPLWNQHQCIPFENTTTVSTTVSTITATSVSTGSTVTLPTSTESTTGKPKDDRETIIVIVAVVVAIVIVIAFIVVIVVIVCRRKTTNPEPIPGDDDEFSVYYEPAPDPADGYETLVLPCSTDTYDTLEPSGAGGLANGEKPQQQPGPPNGGPTVEGAVGGVENPSFHTSYDLDNILNDTSPRVESFEKRDKF